MADFVYNVSKGRLAELAERSRAGDDANGALILLALVTTETDGTLQDLDDVAAVLGNANTAEATNTNYARKTISDADITVTIDDTNDRVDVDVPDQTWTGVASGDNWTDLMFGYDADTTAGTDADVQAGTQHDFSVTPDGSDITAQIATDGFFRAS